MLNLKKTAADAYQLLIEAYRDYALFKQTCQEWFQRFKTGNFDVIYKGT